MTSKKNRNNFLNKGLPIFIILLSITAVSINLLNDYQSRNYENKEISYLGLAQLHLIPNTQARQPTKLDIDTGVRANAENGVFALVESRDFSKGDYGKVFAIRIK